MKDKKIGIVGLGRMGANMARCLKDKGYRVTALFDINAETAEALATELESTACHRLSEVKALVNMVMNINTAALAEGLGIGQALGLDLDMLRRVFSQTGANSRVLETDAEDMIQRDHECYFSAAHAAKDSGIALKLATARNIDAPLAKATYDQYSKLIQMGKGELDKSGIAELTFRGRS
jgi:3-hydroxyisobutyrate dehydrogenase